MSDREEFDAIVVGAGPAGIAAAYTMAKAGLMVAVFERGTYPGAKNVSGGILFTTVLNELIPNFWEEAPIERPITRRRFSALTAEDEAALEIEVGAYEKPPFNNSFSVLRAKFDQWFAAKAEEADAFVLPETVVDELIVENGKVVGVRARRDEGDMYAKVVVLADGATSLLSKQAGLRGDFKPSHMISAVKEVVEFPAGMIADRFGLEDNQGAAMHFFGESVKGLVGSGFIYTNKNTLSVGIGYSIHTKRLTEDKPNDLLEAFKNHPRVRRYLKGGKTVEYAAHMIPEYGYNNLPKLYGEGVLVCGDAAGLVNTSIYHEGTNLAMASGRAAGQTVIEAKEKGDYGAATLAAYKPKLDASFVMKDMKKYAQVNDLMQRRPDFVTQYPLIAADLVKSYFAVDGRSKDEVLAGVMRKIKNLGYIKLAKDAWIAKKAIL